MLPAEEPAPAQDPPACQSESTLLRAANGLNRVTRGQVLVADGDAVGDVGVNCAPDTLRRIRRQRIAMVFQQFGLLP